MALIRSMATVGSWTAGSRVLGFLRDILIAAFLGAGPVADAFFVAFKLPNFFRRLFAEGAFNAAFVPLFARRLEQEGRAAAKAFAEDSLAVLASGLLVLTLIAMAAMPWLIYLIAPGFSADPEKLALTIELSRITFPYLLFMALTALLSGLLNSLYRFSAAAAAPILLNLLFIAALTLIVPGSERPGHVLAVTVALAGLAQFLLLTTAAARAGMPLRFPRPRLTPGVKRLFRLMGPGLLSAGAMQINVVVGTIIASLQAGAVSWLYYADRVYQLPLGLIGIAMGVVLLPELSRKLRAGQEEAAGYSLNRGIEFAMALTLPATAALLLVPGLIVTVLFERGAFGAEASRATAWALAAYASGLPAYVLVKLLQPAFFAREDTVTPLRFAVASVLANIVLSLLLFLPFGHVGIALATALSSWLNTGLLWLSLRRQGFFELDARLRARLPRVLGASLAMGALVYGLALAVDPWLDQGLAPRIAALVLVVGAGVFAYAGFALALGALRTAELRNMLSARAR